MNEPSERMIGAVPRRIERTVPGTIRFQLRSPPPKKLPQRVMTTGRPNARAYILAIRSAHDLLTSYG